MLLRTLVLHHHLALSRQGAMTFLIVQQPLCCKNIYFFLNLLGVEILDFRYVGKKNRAIFVPANFTPSTSIEGKRQGVYLWVKKG